MTERAQEALLDIHDELVVSLVSYEDEFVQKLQKNNLLNKYQATLLGTKKDQVQKIDYLLKFCVVFQLKNGKDGPFQVLIKLMLDSSSDNKNFLSFVKYIKEKTEASEYPIEQVTEHFTSHQKSYSNFPKNTSRVKLKMTLQGSGKSEPTDSFNHVIPNHPAIDVNVEVNSDMIANQQTTHHTIHPNHLADKESFWYIEDIKKIYPADTDLSPSAEHYYSNQEFMEESITIQPVTGDLSMNKHPTSHVNPVETNPSFIGTSQQASKDTTAIQQETEAFNTHWQSIGDYNLSQQVTDDSNEAIENLVTVAAQHSKRDYSNANQYAVENANLIQQKKLNYSAIQDSTNHNQQVVEEFDPVEQTSEAIEQATENSGTNQSNINQYTPSQFVTASLQNTPDHFNQSGQPMGSISACQLEFGQQVTSPHQESMSALNEINHSTNNGPGKHYSVLKINYLK